MKKHKYTKKNIIKSERKVDVVIFLTILGLLIGLPLMQLVRMVIAGFGNMTLYYNFHCGYLIWLTIPIFITCYLIILLKYKEKIGIIDIICFVLLLFSLISSLQAIDIKLAFIGALDRYEGFFTHLGYISLFLCLIRLNSKKRMMMLLNLFICLGVFQSLYAFGQSFIRGDFFLSFLFPYMANALCGNPNFLGSYLLLTSLLSIYLSIYSNKYNKLYFASGIINGIGLVLAQSTVPYLSFIIGLISIFAYTFFTHKDLFKKCLYTVIINLLSSLLMVYISVPLMEDIHKDYILPNYTIKDDISQMLNFFFDVEMPRKEVPIELYEYNTSFYSGRLFIWKNTLKISKNHILFGIGYDNLGYLVYNEYGLYIDKAHNHYLNTLVSNGIFALLAYLTLLTIIIIKGLKSKQVLSNILSLAIISFIIHYFFSASVIEVTPYFITVCGSLLVVDKLSNDKKLIYTKE